MVHNYKREGGHNNWVRLESHRKYVKLGVRDGGGKFTFFSVKFTIYFNLLLFIIRSEIFSILFTA